MALRGKSESRQPSIRVFPYPRRRFPWYCEEHVARGFWARMEYVE